jgi:hypothetical protein
MVNAGGTLAGGLARAGMYNAANKPPTQTGSMQKNWISQITGLPTKDSLNGFTKI